VYSLSRVAMAIVHLALGLALASPAGAQGGTAAPTELEIASYNVQLAMPDAISHLLREWPGHKPNVAARARAIAARLACFDVVGLQEVVSDRRRRQLLEGLEAHGRACGKPSRLPSGRMFTLIDGPDATGPGLPPVDDELALASRLPIVASAAHVYENSSIDESVVAKGVLHARLARGAGEVLDVFVTHLQAGKEHPEIRRRQIEELAGFVRARASGGTSPVLVMGDLNLWGGEPDRADPASEYNFLISALDRAVAPGRFVDLWLATHPDDPETASGTKPRVLSNGTLRPREKRIDYILATVREVVPRSMRRDFFVSDLIVDGAPVGTLSNHAALLATIGLPPVGPGAPPSVQRMVQSPVTARSVQDDQYR
jgi:endonuclease/exonuclease/phosphatase family metal-dependent hydrolase